MRGLSRSFGFFSSSSTTMHQELIDAIVKEVGDHKSLKACALTASSFRGASQRILHRSLTLKGGRAHGGPGTHDPTNHNAAYALLTESPHIIPYITNLTIVFPSAPTPPADAESLKRVLAKLTRVTRCILDGNYISKNHHGCGMGELVKALSTPLLGFISRQSLRELHMHNIILSLEVFLPLLASAPTVSLYFVYLRKPSSRAKKPKPPALATSGGSTSAPTLNYLILGEDEGFSKDPAFVTYTRNLRRLSVMLRTQSTLKIISAAAPTLEHIRINCHDAAFGFKSDIPSLPSLRSIDLALHLEQRTAPWFLVTISGILTAASATLEEITVTYFWAWALHGDGFHEERDAADYLVMLAALDKLLCSHHQPPRLRWRFDLSGDRSRVFLDRTTDAIPQTMVELHGLEKVTVEEYLAEELNAEGLRYPV
ncbi:hypothetical protein DFH06DRAFT_1170158 [Mycena polygramma]|nr:hypothetical protein DFH06DRAFT_1170158 [Mycena polygramma]